MHSIAVEAHVERAPGRSLRTLADYCVKLDEFGRK
jgi:hypothetical protein